MKSPDVRVRSVLHLPPPVLQRLRELVLALKAVLPFIVDGEVAGSYAREAADFHSDLDVHLATEGQHKKAKRLLRENRPEYAEALGAFMHAVRSEFGLNCDALFEAPSLKDLPFKACYRILEGKLYHPDARVRMDRWSDGTYHARPPKKLLRKPRYSFGDFNESGDWVPGLDPWNNDSACSIKPTFGTEQFAEARARLGAVLLEVGSTPETAEYGR